MTVSATGQAPHLYLPEIADSHVTECREGGVHGGLTQTKIARPSRPPVSRTR